MPKNPIVQVVLSVYFSGTNHRIDDHETMVGRLYNETFSDEITHFKMGFSGCAIENGHKGLVFGVGLEQQCLAVLEKVKEFILQNKRVLINAYGHSRGGIACYLLSLLLKQYPRNLVKLNLAVSDPVPGNYLTTFSIDFLKISLGAQTFDLSNCHNIQNVLAIYINETVSNFLPYAPLLPKYPTTCNVTEEILPGDHSDAQIMHDEKLKGNNYQSKIAFYLFSNFLKKLGTQFHFSQKNEKKLLKYYNAIFNNTYSEDFRETHSTPSTCIKSIPEANFISPIHKKLLDQTKNRFSNYLFRFEPSRNHPTPKKRTNKIEENLTIFEEFLTELQNSLSEKSKNSDKGILLQLIKEHLPKEKMPSHQFKNMFRNLLAICLQRNDYAYSLFTISTSGNKAVQLLNTAKYQAIKEIIFLNPKRTIQYSDLRHYVLGKSHYSYFNASRSKDLYNYFKKEITRDENQNPTYDISKLFDNNMSFYLSR